jgi:hypothetical protein
LVLDEEGIAGVPSTATAGAFEAMGLDDVPGMVGSGAAEVVAVLVLVVSEALVLVEVVAAVVVVVVPDPPAVYTFIAQLPPQLALRSPIHVLVQPDDVTVGMVLEQKHWLEYSRPAYT